MTQSFNANLAARVAGANESPVYFLRIDGLSHDYATGQVQNAGTTKKTWMEYPSGGGATIDLVSGYQTVQEVTVTVFDVDNELTQLVAVRSSGAPLSTLVNRKATVYLGFKQLDESDYESVFVGRVRSVAMNRESTGFVFTLTDVGHMLDGSIMASSSADRPASIRGNVVNVYWSLLAGHFSSTHGTFPLEFVSSSASDVSPPLGLGIDTALINDVQLVQQRDTWHANDVVHAVFTDKEEARNYLTQELFRAFQSFPAISGEGLLGLRFHVPSLPLSAATAITKDDIIAVENWETLYDDHLNSFSVKGDHSFLSDDYETELYSKEDTSDQSATGETIQYAVESKWIRTDYDGAEIARELAERMRLRFLVPPARVVLRINARHLDLEQGDVVKVTDDRIPDLFAGTRGVSERMMTILAIRTDWESGDRILTLLDTGGRRYGLIGTVGEDPYSSATTEAKETFFYISDTSGQMSDGTDGYRFI